MLPKRLQSEMVKEWVMDCIPQVYATQEVTKWNGDTVSYGLYTSGICYPRGYKVKWWHSELIDCIPQVYATQEVTKWNGDTVSYGLYTSGICYPRGYKVKWWHSELWIVYLRYMLPKRLQSEMVKEWVMDCIPQVYATQEVTKWNGDTVSYGLYTSGICYPRGYKVKWWHSELIDCIPQVYATQEVTKWTGDTVS